MNYWIESGTPKKKLVMGMPLYGQSFTLTKVEEHGLNAPAKSGGKAGVATRAKGFLAYHEVCRLIQQGYAVVKDDVSPPRMGPYAYKGNQWVGFDDTAMIEQKCKKRIMKKTSGLDATRLRAHVKKAALDNYARLASDVMIPQVD